MMFNDLGEWCAADWFLHIRVSLDLEQLVQDNEVRSHSQVNHGDLSEI